MSKKIRIKFVSKNPIEHAHFTELPNRHPEMEFVLDPAARDYDWFVVYDDLPRSRGERFPVSREPLACPARNTILMTYEPSSVKFYGDDYTNQFAHVLTSHEPDMLSHAGRHDAPPAGKWFYGSVADALRHSSPPEKDAQVCIFLSAKRMSHTLHGKRFAFQKALTRLLPELDVYGRGIRHVEKKAECLDRYRYTVAVENHVGPHHWTEKLSDSYLGYCLPFYFGCPDAAVYFPEESFISIDMDDPRAAADTIREAVAGDEYRRRLPAINEGPPQGARGIQSCQHRRERDRRSLRKGTHRVDHRPVVQTADPQPPPGHKPTTGGILALCVRQIPGEAAEEGLENGGPYTRFQ